jgi:propanol-preferring alcohol dehydrogenase
MLKCVEPGAPMMQAMVLETPLSLLQPCFVPTPAPARGQVLLRVEACGVCRTDLHLVDGELPDARYPIVPGHEIVGRVEAVGEGVTGLRHGQRLGVPWLGWTCGECEHCRSGHENLCDHALFTGCQINGGYADHALADQRYCFPLPEDRPAAELAPLLCAGLIAWRALSMVPDARRIGLYGFGAAAHILAQVLNYQQRPFYAFTRRGDGEAQTFARRLGAAWAGDSHDMAPVELDAALIFAPVGDLVPAALRQVKKGGCVVCGGIHMSDIPSFPYRLLWGERQVRSVANLTREDGTRFLEVVAATPVKTEIRSYPLEQANEALADLRCGAFQGAAVLIP